MRAHSFSASRCVPWTSLVCESSGFKYGGSISQRRFTARAYVSKNTKSWSDLNKEGDRESKETLEGEEDGEVDYLSSYYKISGATKWESTHTDLEVDPENTPKKIKKFQELDEAFGLNTEKEEKVHVKRKPALKRKPEISSAHMKERLRPKSTKDDDMLTGDIQKRILKNQEALRLQEETNQQDTDASGPYEMVDMKNLIQRVRKLETNSSSDEQLDDNNHTLNSLFARKGSFQKRDFSTCSVFLSRDRTPNFMQLNKMKNFMKEYEYTSRPHNWKKKRENYTRTREHIERLGSRISKTYGSGQHLREFEKENGKENNFRDFASKINYEPRFGEPEELRDDGKAFSVDLSEDPVGKTTILPRPEYPKIDRVRGNANHVRGGWESRKEYNIEFENVFGNNSVYKSIKDRDLGKVNLADVECSVDLFSSFEKTDRTPTFEPGDIVKFARPHYYLGLKGVVICDTNNELYRDALKRGRARALPKASRYVVLVIRRAIFDPLDQTVDREGRPEVRGFYTRKHDNVFTSREIKRSRLSESKLYHPSDPYFFSKRSFVHEYFNTTDPHYKPPVDEVSIHAQKYFGGYLDVLETAGLLKTGHKADFDFLKNPQIFNAFVDVVESPFVERDIITPELKEKVGQEEYNYLFSGEGKAFEVRDF